jgi:heme exporter protein D
MHWSSFAEFAEMGGYALYVWGSFAMAAAALVWEAAQIALQRRRTLEDLRDDARTAQRSP